MSSFSVNNKQHGVDWGLGDLEQEVATGSPQGKDNVGHWEQGRTRQETKEPPNWSKVKAVATQCRKENSQSITWSQARHWQYEHCRNQGLYTKMQSMHQLWNVLCCSEENCDDKKEQVRVDDLSAKNRCCHFKRVVSTKKGCPFG